MCSFPTQADAHVLGIENSMYLLKSISHDARFNCALERHLLFEHTEDFLLFYINYPSVIVGKNQSIEAEADIDYCREHSIEIVRRLSGGGTVFHDLGNINYAFITNKSDVSLLDRQPAQPIVEALAHMGIEAHIGKRGEILVGELKVSGTAAYSGQEREIFHGTLLYDTNLEAMQNALRGDITARGRKVASVPSKVCNLKSLWRAGGTTEQFMNAILTHFCNMGYQMRDTDEFTSDLN